MQRIIAVEEHIATDAYLWLRRIDNRHAFTSRMIGAAVDIPQLQLIPSEYFRRNFVLTTSGIDDPAVLGLALTAVGDDNIMFAIDTPYEDTNDAVEFLRTAPLTDIQRAKISHATAERTFRLH
jgi:5-carboxyvanillate decarboxylase